MVAARNAYLSAFDSKLDPFLSKVKRSTRIVSWSGPPTAGVSVMLGESQRSIGVHHASGPELAPERRKPCRAAH